MFQNPEVLRMLMDERQRSIARMSRRSLGHGSPAPERRLAAPERRMAAPEGRVAAPGVRSRPVGPPAYYRGIAVGVWRDALRRGATVRPTVAAPAA
jgi:hypothetical protein